MLRFQQGSPAEEPFCSCARAARCSEPKAAPVATSGRAPFFQLFALHQGGFLRSKHAPTTQACGHDERSVAKSYKTLCTTKPYCARFLKPIRGDWIDWIDCLGDRRAPLKKRFRHISSQENFPCPHPFSPNSKAHAPPPPPRPPGPLTPNRPQRPRHIEVPGLGVASAGRPLRLVQQILQDLRSWASNLGPGAPKSWKGLGGENNANQQSPASFPLVGGLDWWFGLVVWWSRGSFPFALCTNQRFQFNPAARG